MTYQRAGDIYFSECLGYIDAFTAVPDYCDGAKKFHLIDGTDCGLAVQPSYIDDVHLNQLIPGGCISCGLTDSLFGFTNSYSFISGIITVDLALEAVKLLNGVHLLKVKIPSQRRVTETSRIGALSKFEPCYATLYLPSVSTEKVLKKTTQRHSVHNGEGIEEAIVVECL
jgi:hypothetical protein